MNIELRRYRICPDTIDGRIYIDGGKVCDSAENARHCLPPGTYQIILARSRKHARKMPWIITDQSSRISHRVSLIESGNGVYNLHTGTILVGRYLVPGIVTHSRPAFDALYERIRKNLERGNEVTLTIKTILKS